MTYVVVEECIQCKHTDCVAVCPVDCFHEGEDMRVIHPDKCIDCGVCEPECPVDAIRSNTGTGLDMWLDMWLELNARYAALWPVIVAQKDPLPPAGEWADKPGRPEHLSANPGGG